jgi:hypothetical protein
MAPRHSRAGSERADRVPRETDPLPSNGEHATRDDAAAHTAPPSKHGDELAVRQRLREIEAEGEPLSLAEEIAEEADRRGKGLDDLQKNLTRLRQGESHLAELQKMSMSELIEAARRENVKEFTGLKKQDLIFNILKERVKLNGLMYGEGTLEILPDGFGFLRSPDYHYLSCPDDIYVSPSQIRRFGLRTGATVSGTDPPAKRERTLLRFVASGGGELSGTESHVAVGAVRRPDAHPSR